MPIKKKKKDYGRQQPELTLSNKAKIRKNLSFPSPDFFFAPQNNLDVAENVEWNCRRSRSEAKILIIYYLINNISLPLRNLLFNLIIQ